MSMWIAVKEVWKPLASMLLGGAACVGLWRWLSPYHFKSIDQLPHVDLFLQSGSWGVVALIFCVGLAREGNFEFMQGWMSRLEPWGIAVAIVALVISVVQFQEEREERELVRKQVADNLNFRDWQVALDKKLPREFRVRHIERILRNESIIDGLRIGCIRDSESNECAKDTLLKFPRYRDSIPDRLSIINSDISNTILSCGIENILRMNYCDGNSNLTIISTNLNRAKIDLPWARYLNLAGVNFEDGVVRIFDPGFLRIVSSNIKNLHIIYDRNNFERAITGDKYAENSEKYDKIINISGSNISGVSFEEQSLDIENKKSNDIKVIIHDSWFYKDNPPKIKDAILKNIYSCSTEDRGYLNDAWVRNSNLLRYGLYMLSEFAEKMEAGPCRLVNKWTK